MPKFSVNVSFTLTEPPFLDRFAAAGALGFRGVDIQFPYEHPADALARAAREAGVEVVLLNVPLGHVCDPASREAFEDDLAKALAYTRAIGNRRVNLLAGAPPAGAEPAACRAALIENVRKAADAFRPDGVTVMLEFINGRGAPGFLLQTPEDALGVIDAAGRANLALQFDLYHRQVMQGDLVAGVERFLPRIAHIQFADNPGRHEPGTGEIAYGRVFAALDRLGYDGWVGAEYIPSRPFAETLAWLK